MLPAIVRFHGRLAVNGAQTAKVNYGINRGWLAHHNSDVWAQAAPTGCYDSDPKAHLDGRWPMAGVWLCQHLWEHYAFGGDKNTCPKRLILMKGAAEFLLQWLQKDPETGTGLPTIHFTENRFAISTRKERNRTERSAVHPWISVWHGTY